VSHCVSRQRGTCGRQGSWAAVPTRETAGHPVDLPRGVCRRHGPMHRPLSRRCWTWRWRSRWRRLRRTSCGGGVPWRQRTRRSRVAFNPSPSGRHPLRGRPSPARPSLPPGGLGEEDVPLRIRIHTWEGGPRRLPGRRRGAEGIPRARVPPRGAGGVGVPSAQVVSWMQCSARGEAASSRRWGGSGTLHVSDALGAGVRWRTRARVRPRLRCTRASRCTRSASETCTTLGAARAGTSFSPGATA